MSKIIGKTLERLGSILEQVDDRAPARMAEELLNAKSVYISGAGSSGSIGNFPQRLSHRGMGVYYRDQTVFPSPSRGDVLMVLPGPGGTLVAVKSARAAKELESRDISLTSYPGSALGKLADRVTAIRGRESVPRGKDFLGRQLLGEYEPLKVSGIIFEVADPIFLEGAVSVLAEEG